jgi:IS30 family transposase
VSHETIYKSIFVQARVVLKKELQKHLRTQRAFLQSRGSSLRGAGLVQIVDGVSIADRPAEIEDRAVPGHWEGDLIAGFAASYIATLVEHQSQFTCSLKSTLKIQQRGYRLEQTGQQASQSASPITDLGSGHGAGRP